MKTRVGQLTIGNAKAKATRVAVPTACCCHKTTFHPPEPSTGGLPTPRAQQVRSRPSRLQMLAAGMLYRSLKRGLYGKNKVSTRLISSRDRMATKKLTELIYVTKLKSSSIS